MLISIKGKEVTITDTGIGMSDQDQDHAFHAFSRGSQARPGGHGVGLNIVGKLSERFGWPSRCAVFRVKEQLLWSIFRTR